MTEYEYIINSTSLKETYDRVTQIINGLLLQQVAALSKTDVESYTLDDGQTRINTVYRSPEQISKAILNYRRYRNEILAGITGTRVVRLADAESIQSNGRIRRH